MTLPLLLGCWLSLAAPPAHPPAHAFAPPAFQEERPQTESADPWEYYRNKYDKDGDGEISRKEYGRPREYFDQLDRDHDGVLTAADWKGKIGKDPKAKRPKRAKELKVGQRAPKFELPILELEPEGEREDAQGKGKSDKQKSKQPKTIKLTDYAKNGRPVALIFGSYT